MHVWKPHVITHVHTNSYTQTDDFENFQIIPQAISQGIPYDYASIMHYSASGISKNGQFTIVPIIDTVSPDGLSTAITPTPFDYLHVNLLYCGGKVLHIALMYVYMYKLGMFIHKYVH